MTRFLGLVATSALGARALLIPPGVTPPTHIDNLAISPVDTKNSVVRLPCSACVFPYERKDEIEDIAESDKTFWIQGSANNLLLNFTISEDHVLELNGEVIYPWSIFSKEVYTVTVDQVPASATLEDIQKGEVKMTPLEVTAAGVTVGKEIELQGSEGDVIIPLRYAILGLEEQDMLLDQVSVTLLRLASGELDILDVEVVPSTREKSSPGGFPFRIDAGKDHDDVPDAFNTLPPFFVPGPISESQVEVRPKKQCGRLPGPICELRNFIESKISSLNGPSMKKKPGCAGRKGHKLPTHIKPGFLRPDFNVAVEEIPPPPPPFEGRPHHFREHHHGHGHHHRTHGFMYGLAQGFTAVIIPTLLGIAAGMMVSAIGLLVGRLIVFIWTKSTGGSHTDYTNVASDDYLMESGDVSDEKIVHNDELELEHEAPPVYENAPAYEDTIKL